MLFHVAMDLAIPHDIDPSKIAALKAAEKGIAEALQRDGR